MEVRVRKTDLLEDVRRAFKALDARAQGFVSLESFEQVLRCMECSDKWCLW